MKITSIKFIKGIVRRDLLLESKIPQIAFIGRSNCGKSSLINTLTNSKVARISSFPGRTQEINIFFINESFYLIDLPGYGFTKTSGLGREKIGKLINMYFFDSIYKQKKVILIIDSNIGFTEEDISIFEDLKNYQKDIIIVANKIDKLTQSKYHKNLTEIKKIAGDYPVIPFSSTKHKGKGALINKIFS